jgi:formate dehydrogenase subunit gamma
MKSNADVKSPATRSPLIPEATSRSSETIERFSPATRVAHWALAVPFLALLGTGLALFVPELKAIHIGGYRLLALMHVLTGIVALTGPVALLLGLRASKPLRSDIRAALSIRQEDIDWLTRGAALIAGLRRRLPEAGKFNAGQKLNTAFSLAITSGLLATGAVLAVNFFWRGALPPSFVEDVFPWHTRLMVLSLPVIAGHIYLALVHPSTRHALRGIVSGRVNRAWAMRHHPRWVEELEQQRAAK